MGTRGGRKIEYAPVLVNALSPRGHTRAAGKPDGRHLTAPRDRPTTSPQRT